MKLYHNNIEILDILVDDTSVRYRSIMQDNNLTLNFSTVEPVSVPVGSYCEFEGDRYTLYYPENFKKHNTRNFEYTLVLHSNQEALKLYKFKDLSAKPYRLKFTLTARPYDFIKLLVDNLNQHDSGWSVGGYIEADHKLISFNHEFCYDVLNRIAQEFNTEWEIENKTIHLRKIEKYKDDPLPLSYGKGNGFKSGVGRSNEGDKQPIGRLYVQGGERNIDYSTYNSQTLLLPKGASLEYEGKTYHTDADGMYITRAGNNNVAEDSYDASEMYPKRVGTISDVIEVDADKHFYDIIDISIPENLNYRDCRIAGEKATIIFQSGALAGREFDILQTENDLIGYDHAQRKFEIVPQELDGMTMPGGVFVPAVGDKYAIFNISMPQAYISDDETKSGASWDMFREAVKVFSENEEARFSFRGELDGVWSRNKWLEIGGKITLGGHILFSDPQFQPDGVKIRITSIKDYVNIPHKPEITLSNAPVSGSFGSVLGDLEAEEVTRDEQNKNTLRFTKRQWRDTIETMGMLEKSLLNFGNSINPITVQTMQLIAGDESLQFRFVGNKTTPSPISHNVTFNTVNKQLTASSGIIQHMTIGITELKQKHDANEYKFWDMSEYVSPPLEAEKSFYLYARVLTNGTYGTFVLSETAIKIDAESDYLHLLVGILNSEQNSERSFAQMYGFTEILPSRITTDKIVSNDGKTYFDLLQGIIGGRIKFLSNNTEADLSDWSALVEDTIDDVIDVANNAQADANLAKAITDKFGTTIDGGLISTVVMLLREFNSTVTTAGISGLQGTLRNMPSFWSGGTYDQAIAFIQFLDAIESELPPSQFDYKTEYAKLAKITLLHNGAAKIGDFIIQQNGRIIMIDPDLGIQRLVFTTDKLPTLESLLQGSTSSGSRNIGAGNTSISQTLSGSADVQIANGNATMTECTISISASGRAQENGMSSSAEVTLSLYRNGLFYQDIGSVYVRFTGNNYQTLSTSREVSRAIKLGGAGTYTFRLRASKEGIADSLTATSTAFTFGFNANVQGVKRQEYALNGFMHYYSNNHSYFTEDGGFDVRGFTNFPGVLASGTVASNGAQANVWGAKSSITGATAITGGRRVPLSNLEHSSYTVIITPHTNTTFRIGSKTQTGFEVYGSGAFDYVVIGKNYP